MIEFRSLYVQYGLRPVLKDVSLKISKGEIIGLIGPNGSGKTTLIRAASGVLPPRSGQVIVDGKDLAGLSTQQRARLQAVVPQARSLPGDFSVRQVVFLGRTPHLGWLGQLGEADERQVQWALERTDTLALADRRIGELSGGEQQRVLLARALAQGTPILLLDEPTTHLDLRHQALLLDLVHELAREQGLTVLMALHDLNLAAIYTDRVVLLKDGCIQAVGDPRLVFTSERLEAVYQLPLNVITHPDYGTPLVLPDGLRK
jgi:iron complex transport system ATP-binding protein